MYVFLCDNRLDKEIARRFGAQMRLAGADGLASTTGTSEPATRFPAGSAKDLPQEDTGCVTELRRFSAGCNDVEARHEGPRGTGHSSLMSDALAGLAKSYR